MHLATEGNSPSLKAQLGVGWNRALPPPFSFDNGILADGTNDHFISHGHVGQAMPSAMTFSCWFKTPATLVNTACGILYSYFSGSGLKVGFWITSAGLIQIRFYDGASYYTSSGISGLLTSTLYSFTFSVDFTTKRVKSYLNGVLKADVISAYTGVYNANVIQYSGLFNVIDGGGGYFGAKTDECRLYNRILSDVEIITNYNNGLGNNPAQTEGLIWWYDFNKAESDTDLNPGGNPSGWASGAWGIRDKTPNGYHGKQVNFSSNNSTLGGAIQTF